MADLYLIPMSGEEAMGTIMYGDENTEEKYMCSAIFKVICMRISNEVPKCVFEKTIEYLWNKRYEFAKDGTGHIYIKNADLS